MNSGRDGFWGTVFIVVLFCLFILYIMAASNFNILDSKGEEIPIPSPQRVIDQSGVLTSSQIEVLATKLRLYSKRVVISVLILPTTYPEDIFSYSMKVFDNWKLGGKGKDNGVLITIATQDRKIRITTGYGTEGKLTDAETLHIIEHMKPQMRKGNIYNAVNAAIERINWQLEPKPEEIPIVKVEHSDSFMTGVILFLGGTCLAIFGIIFFPVWWQRRKFANEVKEQALLSKSTRNTWWAGHPRPPRRKLNISDIPVTHRAERKSNSPASNSVDSLVTGVVLGSALSSGSDYSSSCSDSSSSDNSFGSSDIGGCSSGIGSSSDY